MPALAPYPARLLVDAHRHWYGHDQLADDPALVGHSSQPRSVAPRHKVIEIVDGEAFASGDEGPFRTIRSADNRGRARHHSHFRQCLPRYRKRATHGWGSAYHAKIAGKVQRRDWTVTGAGFPQARAA